MRSEPSSISNEPAATSDRTHNSPEELALLTVSEVAALLKVTKSWIYEQTRGRGNHTSGLPFVKLGKYLRFDADEIRAYVRSRARRA